MEGIMNKKDYALLPPMGWNSYDYYDTAETEQISVYPVFKA